MTHLERYLAEMRHVAKESGGRGGDIYHLYDKKAPMPKRVSSNWGKNGFWEDCEDRRLEKIVRKEVDRRFGRVMNILKSRNEKLPDDKIGEIGRGGDRVRIAYMYIMTKVFRGDEDLARRYYDEVDGYDGLGSPSLFGEVFDKIIKRG